MGWRAFHKDGSETREETHARPMQEGEDGNLLGIAQEDYGHNVFIDLKHGIIFLEYEELTYQNGTGEVKNPKLMLFICDETSVVGDMFHLKQEFIFAKDENGKQIRDDKGEKVKVRNDILIPLTWRPIWFSRVTNGIPTKVIGAQTTLPDIQGGGNVKKLISLFPDGRIGID